MARTFVVAMAISTAIWALSPWATGHKEPWDAPGWYYPGMLFAGGLVSGYLARTPLWAHYAGCVCGQVLYEALFLDVGPLFVLGVGFLAGYGLIFLAGAFIGARTRIHVQVSASVRRIERPPRPPGEGK